MNAASLNMLLHHVESGETDMEAVAASVSKKTGDAVSADDAAAAVKAVLADTGKGKRRHLAIRDFFSPPKAPAKKPAKKAKKAAKK